MKKSDIIRAYNSVSVNSELKEKIFARLEMEKKNFPEKKKSYEEKVLYKIEAGRQLQIYSGSNMHCRRNGSRSVTYQQAAPIMTFKEKHLK